MTHEEAVLAIAEEALAVMDVAPGLDFRAERHLQSILSSGACHFLPRSQAEGDESFRQIIPFVVLVQGNTVFSYRRCKGSGESRLLGLRSLGLGGHISATDGADPVCAYRAGLLRELREETGLEPFSCPPPIALVHETASHTGRTHIGFIHILRLPPHHHLTLRERGMTSPSFQTPGKLRDRLFDYENWSRLCITAIERFIAS